MTGPCYIWTDLTGEPRLVGATDVSGSIGEFRYAPDYLAARAPAIDPVNLPLASVSYSTLANHGLFGVLADAGPDAWGRRVLAALHPRSMAKAGGLDVLLLANGHGSGALLFSRSRTQVRPREPALKLKELAAAAEAAHQLEQGAVLRAQLRELLQAGTSLGGVHPKVAVADERGVEWIAKFRSREDLIDTPRLEYAAMTLARECGIDAAEVKLSAMGERPALLVRRFDRATGASLHYASAHALWNRARATEADAPGWASYAGLVQLLRALPGAAVKAQARELFRRLVFNVVIGNTDDHGRNHGFLMEASGQWRLAPAFDVLPTVGALDTAQALGAGPQGRGRSFDNVRAGAASFGLDQVAAAAILEEIQERVAQRFARLLSDAGMSAAERATAMARVLLC